MFKKYQGLVYGWVELQSSNAQAVGTRSFAEVVSQKTVRCEEKKGKGPEYSTTNPWQVLNSDFYSTPWEETIVVTRQNFYDDRHKIKVVFQ